jgi:hypothetical protein
MLLLARFHSGPTSRVGSQLHSDRKRDAEPIIEVSRSVIHFPGFRLKSTRSLVEGRFPREYFYFFLKSDSDISARSFVKSSRLSEESVILYRSRCPVSRWMASSLKVIDARPTATAEGGHPPKGRVSVGLAS